MYILTYDEAYYGYFNTTTLGIFDEFKSIENLIGMMEKRGDCWIKFVPRDDDEDDYYYVEYLEINEILKKRVN